jgi:hypothetical protein
MFDGLTNNPVICLLPFIIIVHIILGICAAVKQKRFQVKNLPDFMIKGLVFYGFLLILDITYSSFTESDLGSVAITGVQTLRGIAWLAIVGYYIAKIYGNLVDLGMPRLKKVENELENELEKTNGDDIEDKPVDSGEEENDV